MRQLKAVRRVFLAGLITLVSLTFSAFAETQPFRFAFLSDVHVGSLTGQEDLRATVQDMNSVTGLSFVVLSGDVTEYGSREQLQLTKQILSGLKMPCHVVPGNHDTKWSESGATDFPRIFGDERFNFEFGGLRFIAIHEGPIMKMADGFWSPQDVRWLEETLHKMPDKNQPVVFITHYPLDDGIANWFVVLDLLKKYNTQVVLCGHVHRNNKYELEGVPGVSGRSNLRGDAPAGGYNIVDVADGKMTFSERRPGSDTQSPWHSVVLERHNFAGDTNKYPRPDFSVNARYPNVKPRWQFNTGFTIASTPAVWKDLAIVGDASGTVYGLALKTGDVRWKFKTHGPVYSTPDVASDRVIFASTDGNIYAVNPADGKEIWRHTTGRPIVASPRIADGTVYVGSSEKKFRALNLKDGELRWEFSNLAGFVETRPVVYDGKVIFGAWDSYLYALDAKTGKLAWKWRDKTNVLYSPAACWPVAAKGKIFIAAPDRKLTAVIAKDGSEVWRTGSFPVRETMGISDDGKRLYARALNDSIYAFDTAAAKPEKVWECDAGFGYDINSAMIVEKDGVVFYGTKNSLLMAIDAKTGALRWKHKPGTGVMNTVLPLSANEVLTTDFDGRVSLVAFTR